MKRNLPIILLMFSASSLAQVNVSEMAPVYTGKIVSNQETETPEVSGDRAFWTIQLDVNPDAINTGLAACYWTGTEFWVAKWSNDSLYTVSATGVTLDTFVVAGVSGTRSITSDGTSMYLGANTASIFKVDPVTKTLTSTITTSVSNCRYVTYDPTLNSGAGGFWTGSWATDLTAVSLTGTTLTSIPAATHGLTAIYGLAYDDLTLGGPFLWAFDQGTGTSTATLVQLSMTGTQTGLKHDTQTDLGLMPPNAGLGGGVFIADNFAGENTIGGISQGVSLFAYELGDLTGVDENETTSFTVYPNPVNEVLIVSTDASFIEQMTIYACNGQQLLTSAVNSKSIDVSGLNSGIYILQIQTENGISATRFVKK